MLQSRHEQRSTKPRHISTARPIPKTGCAHVKRATEPQQDEAINGRVLLKNVGTEKRRAKHHQREEDCQTNCAQTAVQNTTRELKTHSTRTANRKHFATTLQNNHIIVVRLRGSQLSRQHPQRASEHTPAFQRSHAIGGKRFQSNLHQRPSTDRCAPLSPQGTCRDH